MLKDERVQCPIFYEITDEENSKIELFVNDITREMSAPKKCLTFDIPKFSDLNHIVLKQKDEISSGNQTLKYVSKSIHFEPSSMKNGFGVGKSFTKEHSPPPKSKTCKFNLPLRKVDSDPNEEENKETPFSEKL